MKLSIVIPALNEENAIGAIIERCLAARAAIVEHSPVTAVEVIVVSDGSTDRTAQIAARYDEVHLIVFEQNRGYGAAIKQGFAESTGELVAFLDADGTCDPKFFGPLCNALYTARADVALGSRLGPESRMPPVRRLGNRVYALILSLLSNKVVTDTASGMRVIRRAALPQLYPLPNGLHFTPAMSARVLMDGQLHLVEVPMTYEERVGESKLHVLRDGLRFLRTICEMTLMWRPAKVFVGSALLLLIVMTLLAMHPLEMWVTQGHLLEGMIYRLLFCSLLGTLGVTLISAGVLAGHVHRLAAGRESTSTFLGTALDRWHTFSGWAVTAGLALPLLVWLVGPGIWTRITAGHVELHWSRVVLAGLIAFGVGQMLVTTLLANILRFHTHRKLHADTRKITTQTHTPITLNVELPAPSAPDVQPLHSAAQTPTRETADAIA